MPHKTGKLLLDISLSCQEISDFIDGKSFEDFQEDRVLQLAIEREFEIIGSSAQIVQDKGSNTGQENSFISKNY